MRGLTDVRRASQASPGPPGDRSRVIAWRVQRLRAAGFSPALARQLARDGRIDLHVVLDLVDRGCRPDLAARIVAPLDCEPSQS